MNYYPEENKVVTLKEIILRVREIRKELFSKWLILGIFGAIFGGIGIVVAILMPPKYNGRLTFVLEESQGNSQLGNYASLANQFGVDIGMESGTVFSEDNLIELLRSRKIVEDALMKPTQWETPSKNLLQYYVEFNGLQEVWAESEKLKDIRFDVPREEYTLLHDSLLNGIFQAIAEENLKVRKLSLSSSLIEVSCISEDEHFSKYLAENLVSSVSDFYINNKTQRSRETLSFIQNRTDSVQKALSNAELELARWKDSKRSITKAEGYLTEIRLTREVQILNAMYGEAIKNLELAKVNLLNQMPLIQVIDKPILPLAEKKLSKFKALLIFGFIGLILGATFVIARKVIRDAVEED